MTTNIHFHPNGIYADKFVYPLIKVERSNGIKSLLITSINPTSYSYRLIRYEIKAKNLIILTLSFFRILRLLFKTKPNSVISHNTTSSLLPLLSARLSKVKNIIYFNHGVPYVGYNGLTAKILRLLEYINCFLATEVITVSTDMSRELERITNKKIKIINNGSACGLDLHKYSRKKHSYNSFRKKINIDSNDTVYIFSGRPEKRKGYDFIINLWVSHFFNKMNYKLLLCGSDYSKLKDHLNEVPKNIIPLGFVDDMAEVLLNSNCLILPSRHEGLSYALLEAMASRCIIISNDIPGVSNLIENEISGYLLKSNDEKEYIKKIKFIRRNGFDKKITDAAIKVVKKFNKKDHNKAYIDFINSLGPK
ncbi:glycosyltransferase [Methylophilaceae bacterium Uisw_099_01]